MSLDPITAVVDLVKTGLDKFVADKMSETDKAKLQAEMSMFVMTQAAAEDGKFRDFVLAYEGAADKLPGPLIYLRSVIRPAFTILVGYLDYSYFMNLATWSLDRTNLLYAINIIVLIFWFGERALANSGMLDLLKSYMGRKV